MPDPKKTRSLPVEALVVAYAMARLDDQYPGRLGNDSWADLFEAAATALGVPASSINNLRDEFDALLPNPRRGWRNRPPRTSRIAVAAELHNVGDADLSEFIQALLGGAAAPATIAEAADPDAAETARKRLETGRLAEDWFLKNGPRLFSAELAQLHDRRLDGCGFDFELSSDPPLAIEVKGIRGNRLEAIIFTDREWREARLRQHLYVLVVVTRLDSRPVPLIVRDPAAVMVAKCLVRHSVSVSWTAQLPSPRTDGTVGSG